MLCGQEMGTAGAQGWVMAVSSRAGPLMCSRRTQKWLQARWLAVEQATGGELFLPVTQTVAAAGGAQPDGNTVSGRNRVGTHVCTNTGTQRQHACLAHTYLLTRGQM